jgi:hypothetical protein
VPARSRSNDDLALTLILSLRERKLLACIGDNNDPSVSSTTFSYKKGLLVRLRSATLMELGTVAAAIPNNSL